MFPQLSQRSPSRAHPLFFWIVISALCNLYTYTSLHISVHTSGPKSLVSFSNEFMILVQYATKRILPSMYQPSWSLKYTIDTSLKQVIPSYSHQAYSVRQFTIQSQPIFPSFLPQHFCLASCKSKRAALSFL